MDPYIRATPYYIYIYIVLNILKTKDIDIIGCDCQKLTNALITYLS